MTNTQKTERVLLRARVAKLREIEKSLIESGLFAVNQMDDERLKNVYRALFLALDEAICAEYITLSKI